jgi:hypothetical protein
MFTGPVSSTLCVCRTALLGLALAGIADGAHAASAASSPAAPRIVPAISFRDLKWEELVPKGWDPAGKFRARAAGIASDNDPRAWKLMKEYRVALDNAPTVSGLDGSAVRIPGYVVPLDTVNGALKEFLLARISGPASTCRRRLRIR